MSGGHFDYNQYKIGNIADSIQSIIDKNGKRKVKEDLETWHDKDWYEKYPEDLYYYKYSDDTVAEFKKAVELLKQAEVYAQRIDWLLSGDDGEENFHERLKEDLSKL